jgi:predicted nicotinamide N-methyase
MAVRFLSRADVDHPITKLQYDLITKAVDIGGMGFRLTTLSHVEKAIDDVFEWLAQEGRNADEIEQLAPYFGVVWPSALALCGFLGQKKWSQWLGGKSLLELGCGLALPSMVAARLGAHVLATDHHPDVPRFLELNAAQNEPCRLQFCNGASNILDGKKFDMIVASDVLYEAPLAKIFADEITAKSHPQTVAVVADPGRPYIQDFAGLMSSKGWAYELQPWSVQWDGKAHDIYVLLFQHDPVRGC